MARSASQVLALMASESVCLGLSLPWTNSASPSALWVHQLTPEAPAARVCVRVCVRAHTCAHRPGPQWGQHALSLNGGVQGSALRVPGRPAQHMASCPLPPAGSADGARSLPVMCGGRGLPVCNREAGRCARVGPGGPRVCLGLGSPPPCVGTGAAWVVWLTTVAVPGGRRPQSDSAGTPLGGASPGLGTTP